MIDFTPWKIVVDLSLYDELVRPQELQAGGVNAVIIKTSSGTKKDPMFDRTAGICADAGMDVYGYHWIDPIEDPIRQADACIAYTAGKVHAILGDFEQWWNNWGTWYQAILNKIQWVQVTKIAPVNLSIHAYRVMDHLRATSGLPVAVYSRQTFVNQYAPQAASWLAQFKQWVAYYLWSGDRQTMSWQDFKVKYLPLAYTRRPLLLPGTTEDALIGWQFTGDHFILPGAYGAVNGSRPQPLDISLFDPAWIAETAGVPAPEPKPAPLPEEPPVSVETSSGLQARVLVPTLNVRAGPGTNYADKGDLHQDETVPVVDVAGGDAWAGIGDGRWAAIRTAGKQYMEIKKG